MKIMTPTICIHCKSDNIKYENHRIVGEFIYFDYTCYNCGETGKFSMMDDDRHLIEFKGE